MNPERTAFLKAIEEAPQDEAARLVYADWLDEHDEPKRAKYIRSTVRSWSEKKSKNWLLVDLPQICEWYSSRYSSCFVKEDTPIRPNFRRRFVVPKLNSTTDLIEIVRTIPVVTYELEIQLINLECTYGAASWRTTYLPRGMKRKEEQKFIDETVKIATDYFIIPILRRTNVGDSSSSFFGSLSVIGNYAISTGDL